MAVVGNDLNIRGGVEQNHLSGSPWIDTPRTGKMTHVPLVRRPNIEKHRRLTMSIFQPIRQIARRDRPYFRELKSK
jgi:hypothetical protein